MRVQAILFFLIFSMPVYSKNKPNFIIIVGEAQGWASLSIPMDPNYPDGSKSAYVHTPNLNQLAKEGARFSQFYAASPRCTPTRAAIVTGKSPAQLGMTFVGKHSHESKPFQRLITPPTTSELARSEITIAELLSGAGYQTAHFGKWHMGKISPDQHGYQQHDGANSNSGPEQVRSPNPKQAHLITDKAIDFMQRSAKANKPFLIQLSHYNTKTPGSASAQVYKQTEERLKTANNKIIQRAAGDHEIDLTIGKLNLAVKSLGLQRNTFIIYTSDHGAQGNNGILSGGKGGIWEGGVRVPLLISGPNISRNKVITSLSSSVDIYPTIAAMAGLKPNVFPPDLAGIDLSPMLFGYGDASSQRSGFSIHFPHYDHDSFGPASAYYQGQHKLLYFYERNRTKLFNLESDIQEQNDISQDSPLSAALYQQLLVDLTSQQAKLPTLNPNFDSDATVIRGKNKTRQKKLTKKKKSKVTNKILEGN